MPHLGSSGFSGFSPWQQTLKEQATEGEFLGVVW